MYYIEEINSIGFSNLIVIDDEDELYVTMKDEIDESKIKTLIAYFQQPVWTEFNNDKAKFTYYDQKNGLYEIDRLEFMDYQFRKLFLKVKVDDKVVEMTEKLIDQLHDKIAGGLISKLGKLFITDDDQMQQISVAASKFYKNRGQNTETTLNYIPSEIIELELAEKFHWTLEYIRSLSIEDVEKIMLIMSQRSMENDVMNNNAGAQNNEDLTDGSGRKIIGGHYAKKSLQKKMLSGAELQGRNDIANRVITD